MQNKLQELTDKIYREGLERGNEEATLIISQAKTQAQEIISKAKAEEQRILTEAAQKAKETKENTESELRIAMRQSVNALKQQLASLISTSVVSGTAKNLAGDSAFIKEMVLSLAQNWSAGSSANMNLNVMLPADKETELRKLFFEGASAAMTKGLELKFDTRLKSGFEIGPANGSFRISFTDEVFESFFREYLRPRLMDYLFGK